MNLINLARKTLEEHFKGNIFEPDEKIKKQFSDKKSCFVTLTLNGNLRGCIGSLEATQPLWKEVIQNTINSAFNDPRFFPLTKEESEKIKIEISILSTPEKLGIGKNVLNKVIKDMGIILKHKSGRQSTFLPQVWEQLPDKKDFLENLSIKAGLNKDEWKESELWVYKIKKLKEKF